MNTYAYVENNPLRYVDPDGQNAINVIGQTLGLVLNQLLNQGDGGQCKDDDDCDIEFVRETPSFDGKTKTCLYKRKGTIFTFPQAVGYACPPIDRKRCLVDTTYIRPPAR